jgi:hypothetical protein
MSNRVRRGLAAAASLLVLAAPAGATPALRLHSVTPGGAYRMWRIAPAGASPRPLSATVQLRPTATPATWVIFGVEGTGTGRSSVGMITAYGGDEGLAPAVSNVAGHSVSVCPGGAACAPVAAGTSIVSFGDDETALDYAYFVVARATDVRITLAGGGWRVSDLGAARVSEVTSGASTGAYAFWHAERFAGAEAAGGRYGSVAWAFLPCDVTGTGAGTLTAPGVREPLACAGPLRATAGVAGPATWRLDADVTGVARERMRLLVVDLPKG